MQIVINNNVINHEILENSTSNRYLLVLPGWRRTSSEWLAMAKAFSHIYNVIILDFPGFGISPKPVTNFDTYDYAQLTKDFIRKLQIPSCVVLGHSFGGRIAVILAAEPGIVEKLVLVDSAGLSEKRPIIRLIRSFTSTLRRIRMFIPRKILLKFRRLFGSADYNNAGELRASFVKIVRQDLQHLLKDIKAETLIIWGDKDSQLNIQQTKTFREEIPNSRIRIVWGAGHNPHIEKFDRFIEILKEFL